MEEIRDSVRETVTINQDKERISLLNKNRNIKVDNLKSLSKDELIKLANDLKKKHITAKQLSELKEVLLQDKSNGNTFLEVDGALESLVRALSGQNAKFQLYAAYCLCNLSLGEKYMRIIKVAGPYLLLLLEGMNTYVIEACLWTLGNLSSHDKKCVKLLKQQGALPLMSHLLNHVDDKISVAAAYALSHFVYTGYDILVPSDFHEMQEQVITKFRQSPASVAYLVSVLSSSPECQFKLLQNGCHLECVTCLASSARDNPLESAWYVRILANLLPESTGEVCRQVLSHDGNLLTTVEYIIARSGQVFLVKECCWLLGNLLNHPSGEVPRAVMESGILDRVSGSIGYLMEQEKGQ